MAKKSDKENNMGADQGNAGTENTDTNTTGDSAAETKGKKAAAKKAAEEAAQEKAALQELVKSKKKTAQFFPYDTPLEKNQKLNLKTSAGEVYASVKIKTIREFEIDPVQKTTLEKTAEVQWTPVEEKELRNIAEAHGGDESLAEFFKNHSSDITKVKLVSFEDVEIAE